MPLQGKPRDWEGQTFIAHNPRSVVKVVRVKGHTVHMEYLGGDGPLKPQPLTAHCIEFANGYEPYDPKQHGPINKPPVRRGLH